MGKKAKKEKFVKEKQQHFNLRALTKKQDKLIDAIYHNYITISTGVAGTGKTFIPTVIAAKALSTGQIDKIVLTRPNVPNGRSLGFRKGTLYEKLEEWFKEIFDILNDCMGANAVDCSLRNGGIELVPFESMRGRSFKDAFIILDEAQNTEVSEMEMFTTRIGEDTTTLINGDMKQSDLRRDSGLKRVCELVEREALPVPIIDFKLEDVVRSEVCKMWIEAWEKQK